jgi:glucokinase
VSSHDPVIGLDIGGTKIAAGWVVNGALVGDLITEPTPVSPESFLTAQAKLVEALQAKHPEQMAKLIGISTAGMVDALNGKVVGSTGNLPALQGHPNLKADLESRTGLTVHVENDANAAAFGEFAVGSGQPYDSVLLITLGTGVGGGIIINGDMLRGAHFAAGEIGHIGIAQTKDRRCTCGRWDCWEAYASGTGLKQTARLILKGVAKSDAVAVLRGPKPIEDVRTHDVIDSWKAGNAVAQQIMDQWHEDIAIGLGSVMNVIDPDAVVIGGGLAQFVNYEQLSRQLELRAMSPYFKLHPATLSNAGIVGAALLAQKYAIPSPAHAA